MNEKKTLHDVYILGQHSPIVHACLTMYDQNIGKIAMFDALVAMVCALAEQNEALEEDAVRLRRNSTFSEYVIRKP